MKISRKATVKKYKRRLFSSRTVVFRTQISILEAIYHHPFENRHKVGRENNNTLPKQYRRKKLKWSVANPKNEKIYPVRISKLNLNFEPLDH